MNRHSLKLPNVLQFPNQPNSQMDYVSTVTLERHFVGGTVPLDIYADQNGHQFKLRIPYTNIARWNYCALEFQLLGKNTM